VKIGIFPAALRRELFREIAELNLAKNRSIDDDIRFGEEGIGTTGEGKPEGVMYVEMPEIVAHGRETGPQTRPTTPERCHRALSGNCRNVGPGCRLP